MEEQEQFDLVVMASVTVIEHDTETHEFGLEVDVGNVEYYVRGDGNSPPNEWQVDAVSIWLDRRAAEEFDDISLPVAKLQEYDQVAMCIEEVRRRYGYPKRVEEPVRSRERGRFLRAIRRLSRQASPQA